MADRETVIKGLKKCRRCECDDCTEKGASKAPWDCPAYDDFVDSAIALLKEQEATEPISFMDGIVERFACKKCGKHLLMTSWGRDNYCSKCGQKVKWND